MNRGIVNSDLQLLKQAKYILFLILLIALCIKLVYFFQLKNTPYFSTLLIDEKAYHSKALKIIDEGWFGKSAFYQAPLYPFFLAVIYSLFGSDTAIIRLLQILLSLTNIIVIYHIGKELFSKKVGICSGLFAALYGTFIFYDLLILKVSLSVFFTGLLLLMLIKISKSQTVRNYFLAGLCLGLNITLRENYLLLIPGILIWIYLFSSKFSWKIRNIIVFIAGAIIVISPIAIRNYYLENDFLITSYQGGANLYMGNNPLSNGTYTRLKFLRSSPEFEEEDFRSKAEKEVGRRLKPSEVSDYWVMKSIQNIQENPLFYAKLFINKVLLFLNNHEIPDNHDYYFMRDMTPVLKFGFISFGLLFTFSIAGIYLSQGSNSSFWILYIFIINYTLSVVIFYVNSRYRMPVVSALIPFAAYTVMEGSKKIRKLKGHNLISLFIIIVLSVFIAFRSTVISKSPSHRPYYLLGDIYADKGLTEEAIMAYRKSIEIMPDSEYTHSKLGAIYYKKGALNKAIDEYMKTLAINPDSPYIHYNLGDIYVEKGLIGKAIVEYRKTLEIRSNWEDPRDNDYRRKLRERELQYLKSKINDLRNK